LRASCEIYTSLGKLLEERNLSTLVGNEGGYAPGFKNNTDALDTLLSAIEKTGYVPGVDVFFALDVAASEFYNKEKKMYELKTESKSYSPTEWHTKLVEMVNKYPLISIEDPFSEDDWESWQKFNSDLGRQIQIVGDDLLVTNIQRVEEAIEKGACNSLLVKPNQIGSLTETLQAMKKATDAGWTNVVSHRSGETEDVTIAHLATGTGAGQIKTGAPSRGERTSKYNELIRIAEELS
jgi:enolase